MIQFHLPIVPPKATSQGAGKRIKVINGKPMFFKSAKATSAEHDLTLLCAQHAPAEPLTGPLRLTLIYTFPWRVSESKHRRQFGSLPHTTRPDCSNLVKMLEDILTRLRFWSDDSQVAEFHCRKQWGDKVGIQIEIETLFTL